MIERDDSHKNEESASKSLPNNFILSPVLQSFENRRKIKEIFAQEEKDSAEDEFLIKEIFVDNVDSFLVPQTDRQTEILTRRNLKDENETRRISTIKQLSFSEAHVVNTEKVDTGVSLDFL